MIELQITAVTGNEFASHLRANLSRAHKILKSKLRELSVALVNDRTMSGLHFQFLGLAGPTDVLTFPLDIDRRGNVIAGEVVVCVPEARRQAKTRGESAKDEVLLYALHGMLHLSGFDDKTAAGFRRMHRKEDEILAQLGVGPVFAVRSKSTPSKLSSRRGRVVRGKSS